MGEFVRPAEVAKLLNVSERTVRERAAAGDLAGGVRIGKLWRFHLPTLRAALDAATVKEPAPRPPRRSVRDHYRRKRERDLEMRMIAREIDSDGRLEPAVREELAGDVYLARQTAASPPASDLPPRPPHRRGPG